MSKYVGLPFRDDQLANYVKENGLPWIRVGVLVSIGNRSEQYYFVETEREGETVYALPCGCVRIGETLLEAAVRIGEEQLHKTSLSLHNEILYFGHNRNLDDPHITIIFSAYEKENTHNTLDPDKVDGVKFFPGYKLSGLADAGKLCNPGMIMECVCNEHSTNRKIAYEDVYRYNYLP